MKKRPTSNQPKLHHRSTQVIISFVYMYVESVIFLRFTWQDGRYGYISLRDVFK